MEPDLQSLLNGRFSRFIGIKRLEVISILKVRRQSSSLLRPASMCHRDGVPTAVP